MKFVLPHVEFIEQQHGIDVIYQAIANAARTCYASERKDKIQELSDRLLSSKHFRPLEFGTVYLTINVNEISVWNFYTKNPYSRVLFDDKYVYITTNYRVLVENEWLDDLKYLCKPTSFHAKRTTVKFICDRGVSHEFVRHRVFSFAQESTRYCNYTKDKFNNELTFIIPCWIKDLEEGNYYAYCEYHHSKNDASKRWFDSCMSSEFVYTNLIEEGWKPQEARTILPNSLKTELIMTGFDSDWQNFFELRCAPNAHPQAKELADMLKDKFNK